ncbi:MAG: transcriptional regulator [bacterium]
MTYQQFFATRALFTIDDFRNAGQHKRRTEDAVLAYYTKGGRIKRVRRGLYLTIPFGQKSDNMQVDPFLLTGKMADDAVLSYQTALAFYGVAYSLYRRYYYCSHQAIRPLTFNGAEFIKVAFPETNSNDFFGIETVKLNGLDIRVTCLERTFVDVFDRPKLCGSWEEIWRSLEMIEYLNLDTVLEYCLLLGNATTIAKVGWFLEMHQDDFMVTEEYLKQLTKQRPTKPYYISRDNQEKSRMISRWNLIVPESLYYRSWEEPV